MSDDDFDGDFGAAGPSSQTQGVQWIILGLTDLNDYLVAAQVTAINTAALAPGQTDRFTNTMQDVAFRIRRKIQSNLRNLISMTPNAIPPELKWVGCMLIIESMQQAIPGLKLTDEQKKMVERAVDELNRAADAKDVVSIPTDPLLPEDTQRGPPAQVVTRSHKIANSHSLRGL